MRTQTWSVVSKRRTAQPYIEKIIGLVIYSVRYRLSIEGFTSGIMLTLSRQV